MVTKFYSKKQLAVAAGVSRTTFYRWWLEDQHEVKQFGVKPNDRLLAPDAVDFICQKHRIDPAKLP